MIKVDHEKCNKCKSCIDMCPVQAITLEDKIKIDDKCINCGACISACEQDALEMEY